MNQRQPGDLFLDISSNLPSLGSDGAIPWVQMQSISIIVHIEIKVKNLGAGKQMDNY